jgi:hypothetical protein
MPVFRLMPVEGSQLSPRWSASLLRPYCLWIRAEDEFDARHRVAQAMAAQAGGVADAPWRDAGLVACENDDSKDVALGIIRVRRTPQAPVLH